jgi:AraC-like DNA-binding protein
LEQAYRTSDVHPRDRYAYWREAICNAYVHLGCEAPRRKGFSGEISLRQFANVRASFVKSCAQHVYRRPEGISRSSDDYFLLSIQLRGLGRVRQRTREALLNPGDFALYASTDPYELVFEDDFEQLVIQVPKLDILDRLPIADMLTAIPIAGRAGTGKIVSNCLINIANGARDVEPACRPHLSSTVVELLCGSLSSINDRTSADLGQQDHLTMLRIESFLASNLKNTALSRDDVAVGMGMSVRWINELLARRGTSITRRIQELRLERIRLELSNPAKRTEQIGGIAMKWGFSNYQHFSRVFGRTYGQSPRGYRRATLGIET